MNDDEKEKPLEIFWEDRIKPIRMLTRKAIKYFYLENCLGAVTGDGEANKRRDLIERRILLNSVIEKYSEKIQEHEQFLENEEII